MPQRRGPCEGTCHPRRVCSTPAMSAAWQWVDRTGSKDDDDQWGSVLHKRSHATAHASVRNLSEKLYNRKCMKSHRYVSLTSINTIITVVHKGGTNSFNYKSSCRSGSVSVAYLCRMAPMAKFKCAPFLIMSILDIGTIFTKDKPWRK